MNNKFIPIISFFMTVSLIVFVAMQIYWLKEYYGALEQDFSNKVYSSMENIREKSNELEVQKFASDFGDPNLLEDIKQGSDKVTQQLVQTATDSANNKRILSFSKSLIEKKDIPLPYRGDTLQLTNLYRDEGLITLQNPTKPMTAEMGRDLADNNFTLTQLVKINAENVPIQQRISYDELDEIIKRQLEMKGIRAKYDFAILDKGNNVTKVASKEFADIPGKEYQFELFSDNQYKTLYSLALTFPQKDYFLIQNNIPMLAGTFIALLTILVIYIISIHYMTRQKKISEVKSDFINNMSHEFKTPLATISIATDSLYNDKIATNPEKVKYYSMLIKQENLRMKKQVESVLNMSKLEKNQLKLVRESTDVNELIEGITKSFALVVDQRKGELITNLKATRHVLQVDKLHLSNAIINLLDNANKYSPEVPEIRVETTNEEDLFVITISDQGMGMEPVNKSKIFEKFFREETGNIHNVKGQGLGLSYVKKVVELHGGKIHVESEKGKGSSFIIKLPLK